MAKTLVVLSVDDEFRGLCPSLDPEEKETLRQSIISEGCREPILYWAAPGNPIIDGYHRHEICNGEGLNFASEAVELADRHAVRCWILRNQLGRRNLTDAQRSIARGRLYNELKGEQGGDHRSKVQSGPLIGGRRSKVQNGPLIDAAKSLAAQDGVGRSTVKRDGKLAQAVDALAEKSPELARAVSDGEIPLSHTAPLAAAPKATLKKVALAKGPARKKAAKKVVDEQKTTKADEPEEVKDQNGKVVPANLRDVFTGGREDFAKALSLAKQLMAQVNKIAADDLIGGYLARAGGDKQIATDIGNVRRALRFAMPHAICPYCRAKSSGAPCKACAGRGWVGERIDKTGREAVGG